MPPTTTDGKPTFHVLVTGYGSFSFITDNPSWSCVAPLHNSLIHTNSSTIHVTAIGPLKVTYSTILSIVPGLHARPPKLPSPNSEDAPMPEPAVATPVEGYDLTFHLGAGRTGALSLEQVGHKSGYRVPGVDGEMAPVVGAGNNIHEPSAAERFEVERVRGMAGSELNGVDPEREPEPEPEPEPLRGFAEGYECFPEELRTEVDVAGVIEHLRQQGETRVIASEDAGHFLCDFICFGSLAESQRPLFEPSNESKNIKRSKSLFMHVPFYEHEPHTIEEMTEAVRQIIAWVCTKEKALPVS